VRRGRVVGVGQVVGVGLVNPGPGATESLSGEGPDRDNKQ
jgi:hypothetical protein